LASPGIKEKAELAPKSLRVLVAEDNPLMRHTLVKMIEGLPGMCFASENGKVCLDLYAMNPGSFDVVLMDLQMPIMDGFESTRAIRQIDIDQHRARTPIVALTATDLVDTRGAYKKGPDSAEEKLFEEVIIKPVTRKTLVALFSRLAKQRAIEEAKKESEESAKSAHLSTSLIKGRPKPVEVLLVEDNDMIAKITGKVLEQSGCKVSRAKHGQEALAMLIEQYSKYDLVLMDVLMPVMDGWTATRLLRQHENEQNLPPKPVIALSTNSQAAHRNACVEAGCTDFAAKPIDYPTLQALVLKHVPR
jgi:CheY-like chemotaxis protein